MRSKTLLSGVISGLLIVGVLFAQRPVPSRAPASEVSDNNKSDIPSGIFTDPPGNGWVQMAAGITEAGMATYLIRSSSKISAVVPLEVEAMREAQAELNKARTWPTTAEEKLDLIKAREIHADKIRNIRAGSIKSIYTPADMKRAEEALLEARQMPVVTQEARAAMIASAEKGLAEARAAGLKAIAERSGKFAKTMKTVKVVGGMLLIADAVGRIYVWNAYDASPGISPLGSVFKHYSYDQVKRLLEEKKPSSVHTTKESDYLREAEENYAPESTAATSGHESH